VQAQSNKPRLFVYGAGKHSQVVVETIRRQGRYELLGLVDDDLAKKGRDMLGVPILGGHEQLASLLAAGVRHCFIAVGDNHARHQAMEELLRLGFEPITVVDPTAIVLAQTSLGPGTLILGHCHVGVNSVLGKACIISVSSMVGHDCCLEDYVHLTPGVLLGGNVRIGEESFLGLGTGVLPNVCIGRRVIVGAGAAVIRDLPDDVVAAGVPARILRYNTPRQGR